MGKTLAAVAGTREGKQGPEMLTHSIQDSPSVHRIKGILKVELEDGYILAMSLERDEVPQSKNHRRYAFVVATPRCGDKEAPVPELCIARAAS